MTDVTLTVTVSPEVASAIIDVVAAEGGRSTELTTPGKAAEEAREINEAKTTKDDDSYDPNGRIYGEKGEKSRRTKDEIAEDEDIEARWSALWPSKKVPAKAVGELKAHLDKIEATKADEDAETEAGKEDDDDGGFDVGGEPMDLDEFRAILTKAMKKVGGKTVGEIMAPHKNATSVPEDERQNYADKLTEAMDE